MSKNPKSVRLNEETEAAMTVIMAHLKTQLPYWKSPTFSDAIEFAIMETAQKLGGRKSKKPLDKRS